MIEPDTWRKILSGQTLAFTLYHLRHYSENYSNQYNIECNHIRLHSEKYLRFKKFPSITLYFCSAVITTNIVHSQFFVACLSECLSMKIPCFFLADILETVFFQLFSVIEIGRASCRERV